MTGQRVASSLETARPPMRTSHKLRRHPELLDIEPMLGPLDSASSAEILMTLPTLAGWPPKHPHTGYGRGNAYLRAAEQILAWLQAHPGDGWVLTPFRGHVDPRTVGESEMMSDHGPQELLRRVPSAGRRVVRVHARGDGEGHRR